MIAIDFETTGLLMPEDADIYHQPHAIEIYCVKFDPKTFEPIDEFESYIKPPVEIPDFISKITKIFPETVENAPEFCEIYDDLCEFFLGERDILGQNINFDIGILNNELIRIGFESQFPWPARRHCTIEMSYPIFNKRMKLGDLYKHAFGEDLKDAHQAKSDVIATVKCFKWLKENGFS